MKVLHINQSDLDGGAAIAGYRLHQGLLQQGVDSRLLVGKVISKSDRVSKVPRKPGIEIGIRRITWRLGLNHTCYISSFDIPKHPWYQEADVINFHNLHTGYFTYLAIPKLTAHKPAVLTLHDMWSFTGHCAYSFDCDRWKTGCGKCPYPDTYPAIQRDNTHLEWKLKDWVYRHSNLTVVADSSWLAEQAKQSMLGRFPVHHIPYGIDTEIYQPFDSQECKKLLGIPKDKNVLIFSAVSLSDPRKGGDLLIAALNYLPNSLKQKTILLIMGQGGEELEHTVGIQAIYLGYVGNDRLKAIAYSAADLFLFPTRADAFGIVAQEAAACGTPTVAFNVGGVPDIVRPKETGYLAEPENPQDFCQGIIKLLDDNDLSQQMKHRCRSIVTKEYSLDLQGKHYLDIYKKLR